MVNTIKQKSMQIAASITGCLLDIGHRLTSARKAAQTKLNKSLSNLYRSMETQMISPMQKGVVLAKVQTPDPSVLGELDLRTLPKYICYKAALQKEKTTYQTISLVLIALLCSLFLYSRYEAYQFSNQLRKKEYILAPGSFDFTPVRAHKVSDKYVQQTVSEYLVLLGNITPDAVEDQYENLKKYMSKDLAARFGAESNEWIEKVKKDNVTETLQISSKEIQSDGNGNYKLEAIAKRSIFSSNQFLSSEPEKIQMKIRLVYPDNNRKKNWYLEIYELSRNKHQQKKK